MTYAIYTAVVKSGNRDLVARPPRKSMMFLVITLHWDQFFKKIYLGPHILFENGKLDKNQNKLSIMYVARITASLSPEFKTNDNNGVPALGIR